MPSAPTAAVMSDVTPVRMTQHLIRLYQHSAIIRRPFAHRRNKPAFHISPAILIARTPMGMVALPVIGITHDTASSICRALMP